MLFSSITFLYYFLPVVLGIYFLALFISRRSVRAISVCNWILIAASIAFYIWGEPVYVLLLIGQTVCGWVCGLLVERGRTRENRRLMKAALAGGIIVGLGCLGFFKYSDFFVANMNALFGAAAPLPEIALPIGISFYTFQILSYEIDLYDDKVKVQRSLPAFTTYVALFPQLVAGPIVRYSQIETALIERKHSASDFHCGVRRFVFGLAKKVLLANTLGGLVAVCKAAESGDSGSALYTWLYVCAYALHIYFDFSGYSDMAIGIGRMFGFRFPENFNYPYISASVTEFWRRWHISMSSWFRDYVYIRLGGNRVSAPRHLFNILLVWLLTGFWHGADWNFILWGLYYALILLLEKYVLARFLGFNNIKNNNSAAPVALWVLRHVYVIVLFLIGWVFFDAANMAEAAGRLSMMFGGAARAVSPEALYYLRSYLVPLIVCAIGSTPLPALAAARIAGTDKGRTALAILEPVFVIALLVVVTACLVDGSFNPFIYFRF